MFEKANEQGANTEDFTGMQSESKMLFLNIGWMENYKGPSPGDQTLGSFGHLQGRDHGSECHNFTNCDGWMFGHRPSGRGVDLGKLGARASETEAHEILVVWFSKHSGPKGAVIVGWYKNATVYRKYQTSPTTTNTLDDQPIRFITKARAEDCTLIKPSDRNFSIPGAAKRKGGYGQSPNWYGLDDTFRRCVQKYINAWHRNHDPARTMHENTLPRSSDPQQRDLIESVAIETAKTFYRSEDGGNRTVTSVEADNVGWDLEAENEVDKLCIEVKGLSGSSRVVELTPNEFLQMKNHKSSWVLYVVTECRTSRPSGMEVRYDELRGLWATREGVSVAVEEKTGALVRIGK